MVRHQSAVLREFYDDDRSKALTKRQAPSAQKGETGADRVHIVAHGRRRCLGSEDASKALEAGPSPARRRR